MGALTLFVHATVRTMNPARPMAAALAVGDGRLVAVGSLDEVLRLRSEGDEVVDLDGRTVLPGFVDPHNHFAVGALDTFWADCRTPPLRTIPELQASLRAAAAGTPAGEWVRGYGYHHAHLTERRHPTRHELDEAVPDRPALLLHFSHHQGVANSRALAAAGITRATPDPSGGEIVRDKAGTPTGLLFERAVGGVEQASREGWEARLLEVAAAASRRYAAVGITTIQDAAVGPATAARYREAEREGRLGIRVARMAVGPQGWFDPPWDLARTPPPSEDGACLKVFVDGGYRCAMRLRRDGREVESGFLFYRQDELAALLVTAWRAGWPRIACHAIGNLGVETAVGAIEDATRREPRGEGRVRLDHGMFLTRELIQRIRALGIWLVSQPSFLYDFGAASPALGEGILLRPFETIRAAGIPQAFSSDFPCGSLAPLVGIYAAVTRRTRSQDAVEPAEAMPVAAALEAYTTGAARAAGLEAECGSLEVGKRADLIVLSADPVAVPPAELTDLRVERTVVGGETVYAA